MNTARSLILALLTLSVLGCGQKGPLVLPDAQHTHKKVKFPSPKTPAGTNTTPAAPESAPATPPGAAPDSSTPPNPAPQE
jgi:predicted small lipoprotein YifL